MCYRYEKLTFPDPAFNSISTSYLITMDGSPRREHYMNQLLTFQPTRKTYVVHNKGFKHCRKQHVSKTFQDLWHANLDIFLAAADNHEPILVLEDDVEFTHYFSQPHIERIERVVRERNTAYSLGTHAFLAIPGIRHSRMILSGCTHAIIYSQKSRQQLLSAASTLFSKFSHDILIPWHTPLLSYKHPLAVQKHVKTENRKTLMGSVDILHAIWNSPLLQGDKNPIVLYTFHHTCIRAGGIIPVSLTLIVLIVLTLRDKNIQHKSMQ